MFAGSSILITGGTGSFGRAFTKQILKEEPRRLVIYSRGEHAQEEMAREFQHPSLRFFIGDVRDQQRLEMALRDIEIVIHAAALKIVPTAEYNPMEAVQTNIVGAQNVIRATISKKASRVIALSTDKCIAGSSSLELASGETITMRDYVISRGGAPVKSLGRNGFIDGLTEGWHRNKIAGRRLIKISLDPPQFLNNGYMKGTWLTEDHPVLTPHGWKIAAELRAGDEVVTSAPSPNPRQLSLLIGMILGDAHIHRPSKNYPSTALYFGHAENQKEWLELKAQALGRLVRRQPFLERTAKNGQKRQPFWMVRLHSLRFVKDLYESFHPKQGKKIIAHELIERHFSPELMAAWYLDDGTFVTSGNARPSARIATHGFQQRDVEEVSILLTNKGFPCYAYKDRRTLKSGEEKTYWELRFTVEGAAALFAFIGRGVPPTMRYKLPKNAPSYDMSFWALGVCDPYLGKIAAPEEKNGDTHDVYCIDVSKTHNFCVGGIVVHNCVNPTNLYGATKLCAERLFAAAHNLGGDSGPLFSVVRYGNVVSSRGSVVPYFTKLAELGNALPITHPAMTRFIITLPQAVDFVVKCLHAMRGNEIFIPRIPSIKIIDLAKAVWSKYQTSTCPVEIVGIRPGEKLHEVLLSVDEAPKTTQLPSMFIINGTGSGLPEGFSYTSDNNSEWLSTEQFKRMI